MFNLCVRKIPWRRQWQPTAVFLPRESRGETTLVGYSPQSRKESGTMEWLTHDMLTHGKECVNTLPSNYFSSQDELSLVYKELNNDWYMKTEAKDR